MKLIDDLSRLDTSKGSVVTSGTFDGVHVGHQKILKKVVSKAKQKKYQSVVLTFWPHPRFVLSSNTNELKLLTTFEEKLERLEESGIDCLVKIPFTKEFSEWSSMDFIKNILINGLNTKELVIGYDHHFGKNREGGFEYLTNHSSEFGFKVSEISRKDIEDVAVSSTSIRRSLLDGSITVANDFLGRYYSLSGFVKDGDRIGRSIGFPTANIDVPEAYKLIPIDGAYAVYVIYENHRYQGMLNIGWRPTVSGQERRIEVNIFNFEKTIYNERITILFVERLRGEQRFDNIEALKNNLREDKKQALEILNNEV